MLIHISHNIRIHKKSVNNTLRDWLIRQLTLPNPDYSDKARYGNGRVYNTPKHIRLYETSKEYIYIPRGFFYKLNEYLVRNNISFRVINKTVKKPVQAFSGVKGISLYPYQKNAVESLLRARQGILVMPCGSGKTRTMLETLRRLNQNTLIIVGSTFLVKQWQEYVKELFNQDCGIIQQKKIDIQSITVATIQTLHKKYERGEIDKQFLNHWGTVIVDEAHHVASATYQEIINKFPAQYRYGTTATTQRSDGLTRLLFYTLGKCLYKVTSKELAEQGYLIEPEVNIVNTEFTMYPPTNNFVRIGTSVIKNQKRNRLIVEELLDNRDRYNLVLSSRIEHLKTLSKLYRDWGGSNYEVITSAVNRKKREDIISRMQSGQLNTIFATQLADEGLDIPILDRVYLVFPSKSASRIEQRVGRVQRFATNKRTPQVYDFADTRDGLLNNQYHKRLGIYNQLGLQVSTPSGKIFTKPEKARQLKFRQLN